MCVVSVCDCLCACACRVASCSLDGTVRIWTAEFEKLIEELEGVDESKLVFGGPPPSPRNSAGQNEVLFVVDVRCGPVRQLCFSPDGIILVAACEGLLRKGHLGVWDGETMTRLGGFDTEHPAICCGTAGHPHLHAREQH